MELLLHSVNAVLGTPQILSETCIEQLAITELAASCSHLTRVQVCLHVRVLAKVALPDGQKGG